jgi:D-sedoheptulose 7-phosphate isomerase
MIEYIKDQIRASYTIKQTILADDALVALIGEVAQKVVEVYRNGHKIMLAGNGGSAADAQHLAGELVNRLNFDRPGLAALALTTDSSVMTAISNDFNYNEVFARQVEALGVQGDLLIGISTSGNSVNMVRALEQCKTKGVITVGLTGEGPNRISEIADYCIRVPAGETPRIQECHILIGHIICSIVEKVIFNGESTGGN